MKLYLNGQDIRSFSIGLIDDRSEALVIQETAPEQFLKHIHDFLDENDASVSEIEKLYVVVGPGSATALRSVLSIANTIAFASDIELVGVVKKQDERDQETIGKIRSGNAELLTGKDQLDAMYEHGPRITISKKDNLKRSIPKT